MSFDPERPGPNAGDTSLQTIALRGPVPLTPEERQRAKFLRFRAGWDWPAIALDLGKSVQDIQHSLANARTPRSDPGRGTANISIAALTRIRAMQRPGEAIWQTVNRLVGII